MYSREWCECGYQYGFTAGGGCEPLGEAELDAFEWHGIQQYQSASIGGIEILLKEAHLWRFAGIQRQPDGEFPKERHGTGFDQAGILEAVSRYNHPASQLMLICALPWVVKNQNPDGTWGKGERQESTTWAVLSALVRMDRIAAALDRNPRLV